MRRACVHDGTAEELLRGCMHGVSHQVALAIADEYSISAYDGCFVALAEQLDTQLITEDRRLRRAVPDRTMSVGEAVSAV